MRFGGSGEQFLSLGIFAGGCVTMDLAEGRVGQWIVRWLRGFFCGGRLLGAQFFDQGTVCLGGLGIFAAQK